MSGEFDPMARTVSRISTLLIGASALASGTANAESLFEVLAKAYQNNPTLQGARADLRANDEAVNLAKAEGRPIVNGQVNYNENLEVGLRFNTPYRSVSSAASIQAPLYSGRSVFNTIKAAKLRNQAGREELRSNEAGVFSQVVTAYVDVIRDSAIVELNEQNVKALDTNLSASRQRFEVGDVTRTDVAQSDSRLALAQASLDQAQAQLIASKENFTALVGSAPEGLEPPPTLQGLPLSVEDAVTEALGQSPELASARKVKDAARYDVRAAKGAAMPSVSLFANTSYNNYLHSNVEAVSIPNELRNSAAGVTLSIPLYQGGRPAARERQAVAQESSAIERSILVERSLIAQVRSFYASWQSTLRAIESNRRAVSAAEISLRGVKAENAAGNRTILDILNAEQEVLNARVQLIAVQRNAYVTAFNLLASMGRADAADLNLPLPELYDPLRNYNRVKGKLLDFQFDPHPTAKSTSTVSTPVQDSKPVDARFDRP